MLKLHNVSEGGGVLSGYVSCPVFRPVTATTTDRCASAVSLGSVAAAPSSAAATAATASQSDSLPTSTASFVERSWRRPRQRSVTESHARPQSLDRYIEVNVRDFCIRNYDGFPYLYIHRGPKTTPPPFRIASDKRLACPDQPFELTIRNISEIVINSKHFRRSLKMYPCSLVETIENGIWLHTAV